MSWQKARDGILVLTLLGALGFLPPILPFFDRPISLFGVPLIVVYVFGAWLALIGLALWLSYRLPRHIARTGVTNPDDFPPTPGEGPG
ncbi:MAG: hypothetical protein RLO51_17370 [Thalassobaculum sp.]|uniref:hypothetical protein n=1 Tax=Thalassobaculum sp. TaxID=2022740 RepID=UPI0032EF2279